MLPGMGGIIAGVGGGPVTIADLFEAQLRTGTGSAATITTTNGFAPDLYIGKGRSGATDWGWYDTARGVQKDLVSSVADAETTQAQGVTAFNSNGASIGTLAKLNTNTDTYLDLLIKKSAGFFDIVTWTGDGNAGRQIPHALGAVPGAILVKQRNGAANWRMMARKSATVYSQIRFNQTNEEFTTSLIADTATSTVFTFGSIGFNAVSETYVAYVFGHDTTASGLIQCDAYTGNGSATGPTVTLGWRPQFLLVKRNDVGSDWRIYDATRSTSNPRIKKLLTNSSAAEDAAGEDIDFNATDFQLKSSDAGINASGGIYLYMAIRAP